MKARHFLALLLVVLIQAYFLSAVNSGGAALNLPLVTILLATRTLHLKQATLLGLWSGFWWDSITPGTFGVRSVWLAGWGALIWWVGHLGIDLSRPATLLLVGSLGSFGYSVSSWAAAWAGTGQFVSPGRFLSQWLISAVLSGGLAWLIALRWSTQTVQLGVK